MSAIDLSDVGGTGSTTIDPLGRTVTLLLGPYTYDIPQIVVRSGFHIIGMTSGQCGSGNNPDTVIQITTSSSCTNNCQPALVLGSGGVEGKLGDRRNIPRG